MTARSVLLVTLPPYEGGVPAKANILARTLRAAGRSVTVAHFATLGEDPELVAPSWRWLSGARPRVRQGTCWDGFPCHAIGCALPEFEAPYYTLSKPWRALIDTHDRHIAVGGNPLVANLLLSAGVPHLLWCAAPLDDDRIDRVAAMSLPRRLLDGAIVAPLLRRMQERILGSDLGVIAGVSRYSCASLTRPGRPPPLRLPIPTDMDRFSPPVEDAPTATIGFAGRLGDPRKRVTLLLKAVARLKDAGLRVRLRLAGTAPPLLRAMAESLAIAADTEFLGHVPVDQLPDFYRSLDVFVLPSAQEGLGIVGVEAMACGVPVICAARGFGPDDYVVDGETGFFVDGNAEALAERIATLVGDRALRRQLSLAAREHVVAQFGHRRFAEGLETAWGRRWGEHP